MGASTALRLSGRRLQATRAVARDVLGSLRGIAAMLRWSAQPDPIAVAIASFRAASQRARRGEENVYELVLANVRSTDRVVRVLIDIYRRDDPTHPRGHYAYFEKTLLARRKRSQTVLITYDWNERAEVIVEGVTLPVDSLWRGSCDDAGAYYLHATLPDAAVRTQLSLLQELA
jgi:hypothetical protein